ncbi:FTR1 family protein [Thermosipho ferrireducens]|uniref:FTR1 family protein n=1 Tax=Thermosipho ferrireducens TaxID=2571116 RepID=A0ABX7S774_9BACT|nr:FTR1 family protein [Thermosipho ferrireducens]QTA38434.1 FTR1 family protein [Thermosipho ferrireducens]
MSAFLITFRETLEAALIVGIVLGYLHKVSLLNLRKNVWIGVLLGIIGSILGAFLFQVIGSGFEERNKEIYEGIITLFGAFLLTTVILWINKNKNIEEELKQKLEDIKFSKTLGLQLILLISVAVLREGIETVVFLESAMVSSETGALFPSSLGIITAIVLAYLLFKGVLKMNLKTFFTFTNTLLIFFAAGLIAYGVHELQEAGFIPVFVEHVYDINGFINEKGFLGGILKGLFGYNGNPSLIEIIVYWTYLIPALMMNLKTKK